MKYIKRIAILSISAVLLFSMVGCDSYGDIGEKYNQSEAVIDFCFDKSPKVSGQTAALPSAYEKTAENGWLTLYLDKSTAGIAVEDRRSGKVWSSVPLDLEQDTVAVADMQELIKSVLRVDYYDIGTLKTLYSYKNCVNEGGLSVEKLDDGVRLIFSLGNTKATYDDLPKLLSAERYEQFFGNTTALSETEKTRVGKYFTWDEQKKAWVLGRETAAMVRALPEILKKVGYTAEDLEADSQSMGFASSSGKQAFFEIAVEYRLQNDSLLVDVPLSMMSYNPTYPPNTIQLNEFLLHSNSKDGYMFIPDGSGALVGFSTGANDTGTQEILVYSNDKTLSNQENDLLEIETVMPVYGISEGTNGVLAIIEDGDAMARITAQKAGERSGYNLIGTVFRLTDRVNAIIGDGSVSTNVQVTQRTTYGGSLRTRYILLADGGGYSEMAQCYKAYLMQRDGMECNGLSAQPDLYLETIGAITRTEAVLGFQFEGTETLTTFDQAQKLLSLYGEAGVDGVQMISLGALKGGVDNYSLNGNGFLGKLGGKKGYLSLKEATEAQGGKLYLEFNALTVPRKSGGLNRNRQSARTLDQSLAKKYSYNLVTKKKEGLSNILAIGYLPEYINKFTQRMSRGGVDNFALRDMGNQLYADFNKDAEVLRQSAKRLTVDILRGIRDNGGGLVLRSPIMDSVSAASGLIDVPLYSNNNKTVKCSVPFLPMVLSGLRSYAGEAYNEVDNRQFERLKMIETGASPYFSLFYAENTVLRNSEYTYLTSNNYALWLEDSIALWKECKAIREKTAGSWIVGHKEVSAGVYRTDYGNGWSVYTNYNGEPVTADGVEIGAMDYVLKNTAEEG